MTSIRKAQAQVRAFNEKHGTLAPFGAQDVILRLHLMQEELSELAKAMWAGDRVEQTDALADLLYVVLGTAHVLDLDLQEAFEEVHRSNMTKRVSGDQRVRDKGDEYEPPNLKDVSPAGRSDWGVVEVDEVNHPPHYNQVECVHCGETVECIDVIEQLGLSYHLGNVLKYTWRYKFKPKSLDKALWYLKRVVNGEA